MVRISVYLLSKFKISFTAQGLHFKNSCLVTLNNFTPKHKLPWNCGTPARPAGHSQALLPHALWRSPSFVPHNSADCGLKDQWDLGGTPWRGHHVCRGHHIPTPEHVDSKGQDKPRLLLEEGLQRLVPKGGLPRQLPHWRQEPAPTLTTNSGKHVSKLTGGGHVCRWEALGMGSTQVGPRVSTLSLATCSVTAQTQPRGCSARGRWAKLGWDMSLKRHHRGAIKLVG